MCVVGGGGGVKKGVDRDEISREMMMMGEREEREMDQGRMTKKDKGRFEDEVREVDRRRWALLWRG